VVLRRARRGADPAAADLPVLAMSSGDALRARERHRPNRQGIHALVRRHRHDPGPGVEPRPHGRRAVDRAVTAGVGARPEHVHQRRGHAAATRTAGRRARPASANRPAPRTRSRASAQPRPSQPTGRLPALIATSFLIAAAATDAGSVHVAPMALTGHAGRESWWTACGGAGRPQSFARPHSTSRALHWRSASLRDGPGGPPVTSSLPGRARRSRGGGGKRPATPTGTGPTGLQSGGRHDQQRAGTRGFVGAATTAPP
jgi:hypothetical protein